MMRLEKFLVSTSKGEYLLFAYMTLPHLDIEEAHCEIRFEENRKWYRLVFFLYPTETRRKNQKQPVEWQDAKMLFIPNMTLNAISDAFKFVVDEGHFELFENCEPPDKVLSAFQVSHIGDVFSCGSKEYHDRASQKIDANIFNALILIKSVLNEPTFENLLREIAIRSERILKDNSFQ